MDIYEPHGNYKPKITQKMKRKQSNQNTRNQEIKREAIKTRTAKNHKTTKRKKKNEAQGYFNWQKEKKFCSKEMHTLHIIEY